MKQRIVTAAQMKEIERAGDAHGLPYLQMMENAGLTAYAELQKQFSHPSRLLVGLCTGICALSNAILCKATFPESDVSVDAACCACVTPQSHDTALSAMKLCQIDICNEGSEPWRE